MEEKKNKKNSVRIVGYLKENLLELTTDKFGKQVIRGSVVVAVNEIDSHKIQFYVNSTDRNGQINENFEKFRDLLPSNTISIASYLKENPTANFALASSMASKIWVMARFEEFITHKDNKDISMILLKGYKAGFKTATDTAPFVPSAAFTCDVYIELLTKELNEAGEDTGRILLQGILPVYDGSVYRIEFVAPADQNIAKYVNDNYQVTDTVTLTGDVLSLVESVAVENKEAKSESFGRSFGDGRQYVTKFTRERRIYGGSTTPIHLGEEGSITREEVKDGLAKRELKIKKDFGDFKTTTTVEPSKAAVSASTPFSDDLDF